MLVELSVVEQRYHAVMEVLSGAPVTEVARRYGVSRQSVHSWLGRYRAGGLAALADHSHRPRFQPRQIDADVEAVICRLRGARPRWGPRRLLRELNVVEQRYRAVLEVLSGIPVTEVAERYGVARQTVHRWMSRYQTDGISGLAERSHAPKRHPWQIPAQVEAVICDLRRTHRRWGPRRLVFELDRRGYPGLSRSTVYRVLVRHQLIEPVPRRKRREQYRRWERPAPMLLWQVDVTASLFLADGRECKIVTGVDDHSRFCVIAAVVLRANARVVCLALVEAMRTYGVPQEILTDNGSVFTGRFMRLRPPCEVLFDRICRENGITHLLTKVASPTTTGKIERLHQTLQRELLDVHGPFAILEDAQAAVDAWREDYNADRPHQSLAMAFPAARFVPATGEVLGLRIPPELAVSPPAQAQPAPTPAPAQTPPAAVPGTAGPLTGHAVELDRVVPPSGNMWVAGQQIWLGPALAGRTVRLWAGLDRVHVLIDGFRVKTLPSRLDTADLARLAAAGARPAGPPPAAPAIGDVVEVERTVSAAGDGRAGPLPAQRGLTAGRAADHFAAGRPGRPRRVRWRAHPHHHLPGP